MSTKTCASCARDLPEDQFAFRDKASGLRGTRCRDCVREYSRVHYQANRQVYIERAKKGNVALRSRKQEIVRELRGRPCSDCGNRFPVCCMQFDHRKGRTITGKASPEAIANMKNDNGATFARLVEELGKCDVVCANCHCIRTDGRRSEGWS